MATKMRSLEASTESIKRIFGEDENTFFVTVEQAANNAGRGNKSRVENVSWLSTLANHLKYHDLVKVIYSYRGRKRLDGLQLTAKGREIIGHSELISENDVAGDNKTPRQISFSDVMKVVAKLRTDNPEYDIVFDVKLRDKVDESLHTEEN